MPTVNQPQTISIGKRKVDQHYRESMISRLMNTITEALGRPLKFPDGYKPSIKHDGISKYGGSSKFGDLENWLATVAYRYALLKFGGEDYDTNRVRVLSLAEYLKGDALSWYTTHVLSAKRTTMDWSFCDVVTGLYDRYILPTSMQDAREGFRKVRYSTALGVQGYYDSLLGHAQNMAVYPDAYTMLEEFMAGLPQAMLTRCFRDHRLTAEANSLEDWVGAAKEIERCDRTESYYKERSRNKTPMVLTPSATKPATKATTTPKRGGFKSQWQPRRDREEETPPQNTPKPREYQRGRTNRAAQGGRKGTPKAAPSNDKQCFNCDGVGHFASDCPHPKKTREYVRAARTSAGDDGDDEDEDDGERTMLGHNSTHVDDRSSILDGNEEQAETYEIEVSAGDFYENVDADPEYIASLHAFPLKDLGNDAVSAPSKTRTIGIPAPPRLLAGAVTPRTTTSTNANTTKYKFQHMGKTRLRPVVAPDDKDCLATWVTVGDLAAWTLWDSGSTTTGVTPAFAELAKLRIDTLEDPHVLQLGTVGSRSIIKYGANVRVAVANVRTVSYVDIANFDRYDMIVGTQWMRQHKVILDFTANRVIIDGVSIPAVRISAKETDPRARRHRITD